MKKWWRQKPSKSVILLGCAGLILVICYGLVLMNDWNQYNASLGTIMRRLGTKDLQDMSDAFLGVAVFRACLFLLPGSLFLFISGIMHYSEHQIPKAARMKMKRKKKALKSAS
ncbi:MAG: hypothetical protein HUJ54_04215 [Erysipelotrichaceae bacterium]|nr:hypothetical protein [Erysipelotrichaceae bacterium]